MGLSEDCFEYRSHYERHAEVAGAAEGVSKHGENCSACAGWRTQIDDIVAGVEHMPQFDVSEQLTQSILAAVEREPKAASLVNFWLLVPVAVVCAALGFTVMPFDSLEGAASTALGLVGLALMYVLVQAAKTEELPA